MSDLEVRRKELDDYLNEVSYTFLNSADYVPSAFALKFMTFVKHVNGDKGEDHKTPPVHLAMMDKLGGGTGSTKKRRNLVNLCHRGLAKTTLMFEYLTPFIALEGGLPNFGPITGMIYVSDSMDNGVKKARESMRARWNASAFLQYWLPEAIFNENWIEFVNREGGKLGVNLYGAKQGIRGNKIYGKRPVLAVLDDLIGDEDAHSKVQMDRIKTTVYSGIQYALDPTRSIKLLNGTPFTKDDLIVGAVESGAWDVNVWPVCEQWPVASEAEFSGSWPDRFTYDYVKEAWEAAVLEGTVPNFMQELMLRISSTEERLIQDGEIRWYPRAEVLRNKSSYNFYFTTDFAVSEKETSDYTVISVWAYTTNGDWLWVDGIVVRQDLAKTFDKLFEFVVEYQPQEVGLDVGGQQKGFVALLMAEMMRRNVWFTFARDQKTGEDGLRPVTSKLARLNQAVPLFRAAKIRFPDELKESPVMAHFTGQIRLATRNGIKGKDDCLDTISQLPLLNPWKPQAGHVPTGAGQDAYSHGYAPAEEPAGLASYIV
jgi:hypothetical protein